MQESIPKSSAKLTARRGPWLENPSGWFLAGYGPFRRLSGAAAEAQRSMLGSKRTAALVTLFDESASLAESTWWLQELYPKQLEGDRTSELIHQDIRRFLNDGLMPDGTEVIDYTSEGLWVRQGGAELVLEEMSDGYRVVSALVIDILRRLYASFGHLGIIDDGSGGVYCSHEGVVLIDEVDVHLHVGWQQRIGFWLREHFPNIQFIVSTHSPFVAQAASPNGLLRLPAPNDENRTPSFIAEDTFDQIVNGDVDRVSMSHLFGLESTYSEETLVRRRKWSELEDAQMGQAPSEDLRDLRRTLGIGPSDDVQQAINALNEILRARRA
ncbi:AAA family ATPase [Microcella sp.]|uniref:AAA family ATPase n=1 Tax=Microcella sp. TaxID=1913979 RepID=UPI0039196A51